MPGRRRLPRVLLVGLALALALSAARAAAGQDPPKPGAAAGEPDRDAAAALAAAFRLFDGVPQAECATNNPEQKICLALASTPPSAPARGIAVVATGSPPGRVGDAGLAIMGRSPAGDWEFWFGTQTLPYQRLDLPGPMLVCADGDGATVRDQPALAAPAIATLPDLTPVVGEQFVLTAPGHLRPLTPGSGWYRISTPVTGWVHSTLLTDARVGDCRVRDALVPLEAPTPEPDDAGEAAFQAALRLYDAVPGPCHSDDPPGGRPRVTRADQLPDGDATAWRESAARGVATFLIELCGQASAGVALGRTASGDWALLRVPTAGPGPAFALPGMMVACGGGMAVVLHAAPASNAPVVARVPDHSAVVGEEFVLTDPGQLRADAVGTAGGAGWYRLSAPQAGWAFSGALFVGGCP